MNVKMVSGDTKTLRIKVIGTDRLPYSLAEAVRIDWQLAKTVSAATPLLSKEMADEGTGIYQNGDDWFIDVNLAPTDTEDLSGEYYHECQITMSDGAIATPFAGTFEIVKDLVQ